MECNVGKTEKIIRLILGLIFAWLGYTGSPWWYLVAIVLIVTASIGFCPLTKAFGINTCKLKEEGNKESPTPEETEEKPKEETPIESQQETEENK